MAEENETPGGDPAASSQGGGAGSEGRTRRSEGDLLAERRARRAAESGEHALTLRAEAAEATVRTLETHVSSLQQRLRDAEEEGRRSSELIEADRAARASGLGLAARGAPGDPAGGSGSEDVVERELRQVKQREYAEQRLRVEAEDQLIELERESRAEVDRLSRRLGESELEARRLADRLERVQRELAEAEQAAAAERSAARREEHALRARATELERSAAEIQSSLDSERAARERTERLLETMRRGHRTVEALVAEFKDVLARLKVAAQAPPSGQAPPPAQPPPKRAPAPVQTPLQAPLPAPTPASPMVAPQPPHLTQPPAHGPLSPASSAFPHAENGEMVDALAAAVERLRARVAEHADLTSASAVRRPQHKHSQSLIRRLRIARKQRRAR